MSTLPLTVAADVQRILDGAARRLLGEKLALVRRMYLEGATWDEITSAVNPFPGWALHECEDIVLGGDRSGQQPEVAG